MLMTYRFPHVLLVDASSKQTIQAAFAKIAEAATVGNDYSAGLAWLRTHVQNWLLILDNADDPTLKLASFIPPISELLILAFIFYYIFGVSCWEKRVG